MRVSIGYTDSKRVTVLPASTRCSVRAARWMVSPSGIVYVRSRMTPEPAIRSCRQTNHSVHIIFTREADMKRTLLALAVAALGIVTWPSNDLHAQTTNNNTSRARGTIASLGGDSITVKVHDAEMK